MDGGGGGSGRPRQTSPQRQQARFAISVTFQYATPPTTAGELWTGWTSSAGWETGSAGTELLLMMGRSPTVSIFQLGPLPWMMSSPSMIKKDQAKAGIITKSKGIERQEQYPPFPPSIELKNATSGESGTLMSEGNWTRKMIQASRKRARWRSISWSSGRRAVFWVDGDSDQVAASQEVDVADGKYASEKRRCREIASFDHGGGRWEARGGQ
ncbi:hypothetical protein HPP92_029081 [Vanilla planifolia]|uniref:Uncharacterized protein n=1 Tax=Vanilla planifolia TaxID=51239 RepID=A0A835U1H4_VANPL|nr:hypothetical protein HPP92_029070 [Vanilla planifolia]KAG0445970.1 hypothetical protein HPP92_029081 [Vanilla planifolia]